MIWENGIETCILPYVKRTASPGLMHETWCSGLVHEDDPEGWGGEGGGFRMGNTCTLPCENRQLVGGCCIARGAQIDAL